MADNFKETIEDASETKIIDQKVKDKTKKIDNVIPAEAENEKEVK